MKKSHQYKLMVYLSLDVIGMIVLILLLGLNFSVDRLLFVLMILLLMVAHLVYAYRYYLKESTTKDIKEIGYHIKKVGMHTFNRFPY